MLPETQLLPSIGEVMVIGGKFTTTNLLNQHNL